MKKTTLFLSFLLLGLGMFAQYTGNKLPSGLAVTNTASDADYTIIQKSGETYVKAIRMDSLQSYMVEGINANITSLDSVAGDFGQFVISDGVGFLSPVSAKYEGLDAYTFGYRTGLVGYASHVIGGSNFFKCSATNQHSIAFGYGNSSTGLASTVFGAFNSSTGQYSFANGFNSDATGGLSFVNGANCVASGDYSTAFGYTSTASGDYSTAWGTPTASGSYSTAWGKSTASGDYSTAWGTSTANRDNATAWGASTASGDYSTAWGDGIAQSYHETAFGRYCDTADTKTATLWVSTDRLLTIGNGTLGSPSNALVMLKNGNTTAIGNWTIDGNITADTITGYVQTQNAFAEIYYADASVAQSIPNGTTYTKITAFTTDGEELNCTADAANDKITITETGYYHVSGYFSTICSTNGTVGKTALFAGGTEVNKIHKQSQWTNTVSSHSGSIGGILKVETVPIDLDIRLRHDQAGAVNFTGVYGNLSVRKISGL